MKKEYILVAVLIAVYYLSKKVGNPEKESQESTGSATPPPNSSTENKDISKVDNVRYIDKIMREGWKIESRAARIGILATIGKESNFIPKWERGYSNTSNARIRDIFPTKTKGVSDAELSRLKKDDYTWFNFIYNGIIGNRPNTDDGFNFRGSGLNQLTGRANYEKYAKKSGIDIVSNPNLNNNLDVATQTMLHFMYEGWNSTKGKAKLKARGFDFVNSINDTNWAIRFFCAINSGNGDINGSKANKAYAKALPYKATLEKIITQ
jgi:predicted chitinase